MLGCMFCYCYSNPHLATKYIGSPSRSLNKSVKVHFCAIVTYCATLSRVLTFLSHLTQTSTDVSQYIRTFGTDLSPASLGATLQLYCSWHTSSSITITVTIDRLVLHIAQRLALQLLAGRLELFGVPLLCLRSATCPTIVLLTVETRHQSPSTC
jgi:branched-subunit amino acid transport protein AzlD